LVAANSCVDKPECSTRLVPWGRAVVSTHISETRILMSACTPDCADTCAFLYHVEHGKPVEVSGDPTPLGCSSRRGAADPRTAGNSNVSHGTRRSLRSKHSGITSSPDVARKRSCRTLRPASGLPRSSRSSFLAPVSPRRGVDANVPVRPLSRAVRTGRSRQSWGRSYAP
jgi:hypothetical protein